MPGHVYVVTSCPLHGLTEVEGVFSTRERAVAFMAGFHESYNMDAVELPLDGASPQPAGSVVVADVDRGAGVVTFAPSVIADRQPCTGCRGYTDPVARLSFHELGCRVPRPATAKTEDE